MAKKKSERNSSEETEEEKPKHQSKQEKHVEFESQPDIFSDICFESDTAIAPRSKLEESEIAITSDNVSTMCLQKVLPTLVQRNQVTK